MLRAPAAEPRATLARPAAALPPVDAVAVVAAAAVLDAEDARILDDAWLLATRLRNAVMLVRGRGPEAETFWLRRARGLAFPGFHAFPGGSVDEADRALLGDEGRHLVAAARELFEETGVLLAPGARGDRRAVRAELLEGRIGFPEALARLSGRIDADTMRRLNFEIDGRKRDPAAVAREFLKTRGLIP